MMILGSLLPYFYVKLGVFYFARQNLGVEGMSNIAKEISHSIITSLL